MTTRYDLEILIRTKKQGNGIAEADKGVQSFGKSLTKTLGQVTAVTAAVGGAGLVFKKAFDLSQEGAGLLQLEESFNRLNSEVLKTPNLLEDMTAAARGTIKETDLMSGVLTLAAGATDEVAQQFAQAAPKLVEIAKASNKLNPKLGDTAFLFESISKGIKRQSPLILDNLGLNIKMEKAYSAMAESLGISVDALDANQRTIAVLNATMEAGDVLINQVGGDVSSQQDAWLEMSANIGTVTDSFKTQLAEGLNPWIKLVNGDYHDAIRQIEQDNIAAAEAADDYTQAQTRTEQGRREAIASAARTSATYDEFVRKLQQLGEITEFLTPQEQSLSRAWYDQEKAAIQTAAATDQLNEQMERATMLAANHAEATKRATADQDAFGFSLQQQTEGLARTESVYRRIVAETERMAEVDRRAAVAAEELAAKNDRIAQSGSEHVAAVLSGLTDELISYQTQVVTTGGLTEVQTRNLNDLRDEYEKIQRNIDSLQGGTAGLGLTTDQLNEKLEKQYEALGLVEQAMRPLEGVTTDIVSSSGQWIVDSERLNQLAFDSVVANTNSAERIAKLAMARGELTKEEAQAIIMEANLVGQAEELGRQYAAGDISIGKYQRSLDALVAGSPYSAAAEVDTGNSLERLGAIEAKLNALDGRKTRSVHEVVTREKTESSGGSKGGSKPPSSGGGGPDGAMAAGGSYTVPYGYNERAGRPFMMALDGGERVNVTRSGQGGGSSAPLVINNYNNTGESVAIAYAVTERLRRERMDSV